MRQSHFKINISLLISILFISCLASAQPTAQNVCKVAGIACHIEKTEIGNAGDNLAVEDKYVLTVRLGALTEQQFKDLHKYYNTTITKDYDPKKNYDLIDFMPVFIQELNGKTLKPAALQVPSALTKALQHQGITLDLNKAYVDANCHSVTWQWVNHLQNQAPPKAILSLGDGDQLLSQIQTNQKNDFNSLQPGDIGIISGAAGFSQDGVLHSFVYLGFGLVFEKGNPGANYPYRIAYLDDIVKKYKAEISEPDFSFYHIDINSNKIPEFKTTGSIAKSTDFSKIKSELSTELQEKYILQETWDYQKERSVFTLGFIATLQDLGKNINSILPSGTKTAITVKCNSLFN